MNFRKIDWLFDWIIVSPRVFLLFYPLALFPFISTVIGASLKEAGLELWKYGFLLWIACLVIAFLAKGCHFEKWCGKTETVLWLFVAFMLFMGPATDLVIDPWKNWFFCFVAVVMLRLLNVADGVELRATALLTFGLWWIYALVLMAYALSASVYPGSIQHQFFLSGVLGFIAVLLLLKRLVEGRPENRGLHLLFLLSAAFNIVLNLCVTETRSVFPFSIALVLIGIAWCCPSERRTPRFFNFMGLPLAILITLFPVLHLNGMMGNLINEVTYPIFGKLRTIESTSGREAAFRTWSTFVAENARLLGKAQKDMPLIAMEESVPKEQPLFGMSQEQFNRATDRGREAQKIFIGRQQALGVTSAADRQSDQAREAHGNRLAVASSGGAKNIALTSSHNQWLDATARGGFLYAIAIAAAFLLVVWLISHRLAPFMSGAQAFAYWSMATSWGFASQFDDEHWLYHIPYLTLFFIPVIVATMRLREPASATQPAPSQTGG